MGNLRDIKGICFEGIGTVLYTLWLAPGNSFRFPKDQAVAMAPSPEQYHELMSAIALEGTIREVYPHIDQPSDQSYKMTNFHFSRKKPGFLRTRRCSRRGGYKYKIYIFIPLDR